jgi:hypothetical protein
MALGTLMLMKLMYWRTFMISRPRSSNITSKKEVSNDTDIWKGLLMIKRIKIINKTTEDWKLRLLYDYQDKGMIENAEIIFSVYLKLFSLQLQSQILKITLTEWTIFLGFEILTAVTLKNAVFLACDTFRAVEITSILGRPTPCHIPKFIISLMMSPFLEIFIYI